MKLIKHTETDRHLGDGEEFAHEFTMESWQILDGDKVIREYDKETHITFEHRYNEYDVCISNRDISMGITLFRLERMTEDELKNELPEDVYEQVMKFIDADSAYGVYRRVRNEAMMQFTGPIKNKEYYIVQTFYKNVKIEKNVTIDVCLEYGKVRMGCTINPVVIQNRYENDLEYKTEHKYHITIWKDEYDYRVHSTELYRSTTVARNNRILYRYREITGPTEYGYKTRTEEWFLTSCSSDYSRLAYSIEYRNDNCCASPQCAKLEERYAFIEGKLRIISEIMHHPDNGTIVTDHKYEVLEEENEGGDKK